MTPNQDPLDEYIPKSQKYSESLDIPYLPPEIAKPIHNEPLDEYLPKENKEPGLSGQLASRALETYGGSLGNLDNFLKSIALHIYETYDPQPGKTEVKKVREAPDWFKNVIGIGKPKLSGGFPTSQELREQVTKPFSAAMFEDTEALEPKTEAQKFWNEMTEDITGMFTPGTGKMKFWKKISIPVMTDLTKEGLKRTGIVKENTANNAKL